MATLALLLALGCARAALAAAPDPDVPKPDPPKKWRMLTKDSATSKCLGDPRTPLCAVETLLACQRRGTKRLCDSIWWPETGDAQKDEDWDGLKREYETQHHPGSEFYYRVTFAARIKGPHDFPQLGHSLFKGYDYVPGDVRIDTVDMMCWPPQLTFPCQTAPFYPVMHILRKFGMRWAWHGADAPHSDDWDEYVKTHPYDRASQRK
jgi:hypothetical protein